jgi:glutamate dehydrogenase
VERALQVLTDINASGAFGLATLSVALREVRNLITSAAPVEPEAVHESQT